ncbi:MAG: pentapeptide repeat-containing protein [Methylophilaceae bacterium]
MKKIIITLFALFTSSLQATEFDRYCTTSLADGNYNKTDCSIKTTFDGKEYCFGNEAALTIFTEDPKAVLAKASKFYVKSNQERDKITQAAADEILEDPDCDFSNKDVGYLDFNGRDLTHCIMVNTSFFGADLRGANLSGANLQRAYLNLARLEKTNFSGANLKEATIFQPIFGETVFRSANLSGARLIGTLGKVNMSGAILKGGRLGLDVGNQPMGQMKFDSSGGNFEGADFEGADLNIASFIFGNLKGANLRNTNLYRAELIQADLTGADLTGADLTDAEVDGANFAAVKGLDTVKGFNTVKGKCKSCGQ